MASAAHVPTDPSGDDGILLILGGGGIRGLAHVGVIAACEGLGIPIAGILGVSIGAVVGACHATGMSTGRMRTVIAGLRKRDIFDVDYKGIFVRGTRVLSLYRGVGLRRFLERHVPQERFEDLHSPLWVPAVNLRTGTLEIFGPGAAAGVTPRDAVRASAALPGFFPPVTLRGDPYVDAGALDGLPLTLARGLGARADGTARHAVAVHLDQIDPSPETAVAAGMFGVLDRVGTIRGEAMFRLNVTLARDLPLVVVNPSVSARGMFDFRDLEGVIAEGERAARAVLADHPCRRMRKRRTTTRVIRP